MKLVFATNNPHKLSEIRHITQHSGIQILSLADTGCHDDIPETSDTLKGNAIQKALYVFDRYGTNCFADDTGLEVHALGGAPGVYSARYAGPGKSFDDNISKLLKELQGSENRNARFVTVVALIINGNLHVFEGEITGRILYERRGSGGFGYDPVFMPDGQPLSFAEMSSEEKNSLSHRYRAVKKLCDFLAGYQS